MEEKVKIEAERLICDFTDAVTKSSNCGDVEATAINCAIKCVEEKIKSQIEVSEFYSKVLTHLKQL